MGTEDDVGDAGAHSEIRGPDATGRARVASNPDRTGRARPSIADTRVAKSPMWKFITAIWFWSPWMALVKALSASVGTAVIGGGGGGGGGMVASGSDGAMAAEEMVGVAEERTGGMEPPAVEGMVADEVPDVAMISDTRLLRRRAWLRRKYGGDRGA